MAYTVLIADDEKEIRSVLRLYLENAGYRVLEAADGIEAERIFASEKVDLSRIRKRSWGWIWEPTTIWSNPSTLWRQWPGPTP